MASSPLCLDYALLRIGALGMTECRDAYAGDDNGEGDSALGRP
jgi:hypothetical protein